MLAAPMVPSTVATMVELRVLSMVATMAARSAEKKVGWKVGWKADWLDTLKADLLAFHLVSLSDRCWVVLKVS